MNTRLRRGRARPGIPLVRIAVLGFVMNPDDFYDWALKDAERRGLADLKPVLDALRASSRQLREAAWNDDPRAAAASSPATGHASRSRSGESTPADRAS